MKSDIEAIGVGRNAAVGIGVTIRVHECGEIVGHGGERAAKWADKWVARCAVSAAPMRCYRSNKASTRGCSGEQLSQAVWHSLAHDMLNPHSLDAYPVLPGGRDRDDHYLADSSGATVAGSVADVAAQQIMGVLPQRRLGGGASDFADLSAPRDPLNA